ncbi:MAG: hypothetical protein WAL16_06410 [Streptosporangiaceae bacterium]|jgi:hypothetical protein
MASWRRPSDSLAVRGRLVTKQNRFGTSNAASLAWQYSISSCAVALAPGPQDDSGVDFLAVDRSGTPKDMASMALERQNAALAQAEPVPHR